MADVTPLPDFCVLAFFASACVGADALADCSQADPDVRTDMESALNREWPLGCVSLHKLARDRRRRGRVPRWPHAAVDCADRLAQSCSARMGLRG